MASLQHIIPSGTILCQKGKTLNLGISALPFCLPRSRRSSQDRVGLQSLSVKENTLFPRKRSNLISKEVTFRIPRSSNSSDSIGSDDGSSTEGKTQFGYSRKDVILIGVGVTLAGFGLESGLEYFGVDPLQAGNVVQLVLVLGLTLGWISTYIFRVSNKDMTYVQQLRDYEDKVMQKRLEGLTESELEALLEQVEEEKTRLATRKQIK